MLWKNRRKLYEDPFIYASYGDLFRMYDMEWYFWELLIIVMKGLVTGMMAAIAPGTPLQLLLGTLLAGGSWEVVEVGEVRCNQVLGAGVTADKYDLGEEYQRKKAKWLTT